MKRTPLAKRGKNYAKRRKEQFGPKAEWIKTLPCVVCRRSPVDPHHEPPRSLGGNACSLIPLCGECHSRRHGFRPTGHQKIAAFVADAARLEECWQAKKVCKTCEETGMVPNHNGSGNCESGSIASGGTRKHCTCSACW